MKIFNKYTPEEYAAFWGCDPVYDRPPRKQGDGYLFYNFGSEHQTRSKAWLTDFLAAIDRTIQGTVDKTDLKGLGQLRAHVAKLIEKA